MTEPRTAMQHEAASGDAPVDRAVYLKKELENRVQTEPALFEFIQSAALDGLWYWDLENMENEWLSPEFKALFGYKDDEVPNTSAWWQDNIHPEDKDLAIKNFQDHVTSGVPYSSIVRYRHKDGSTVWVRCRGQVLRNSQGVPIRMLGAHNDLTQLMKIQQELKKKEDVLDMLCTTALDGFWDWNMKTGEKILSVRWKNALGYEEDELENTLETWESLLHPDDMPKALAAREKHMQEGAPYSQVLRYKRKDGTIAHMLAQGVAQKDERTGEWIRMFGTHTDVSYLEEARAAKAANQAKTTLLRTMSHELRTPLNAILGMSEVLMGTNLTPEQQECMSTLQNSGKHLLSVISDVLDYSQLESGNLTINKSEFSVQTCVRDVVAALGLEASKKSVDLTFDSSIDAGAKFVGDPERTRQIAFNLVSNAVKFTSEGSVNVSVSIEQDKDDPRLKGVRVNVKDTGCGMSPDQQAVVFDGFTQASELIQHQYGGSGLGLSISQKLTSAMGGSVSVESQLGRGSLFSVWLPGFVPETIPKRSLAKTTKVILYDKNGAPFDVLQDDYEQGSATKAIRAAGLDVYRISTFFELQQTCRQSSVEAVAVPSKDACSDEIRQFLEKNSTALLLVIGKCLKCNLQESKYKDRVLTVPHFPTSDEIKEAMSLHRKKAAPQLDLYNLGNPGRDLRVLLAEDNHINIKVMRRFLSKFPCKVDVACNGLVAVEMAGRNTYDIILMDMIMPEMGGLEATQMIRQIDDKTPIVALTANATTDDRESCFEAGMHDFLTKPINLQTLRKTLTRIADSVIEKEQTLEKRMKPSKTKLDLGSPDSTFSLITLADGAQLTYSTDAA
ncbi:Peroxide stress-activated histidine kinase mak2 [Seminavis robusta]|uniref:Peroxide stress-activated histidine kinase mak2 n=1 Tax=Seminavis robusta TaxID=568900 RepID=A0A9N8H0G4_9STRA|nr:Peroxide stress-activated histidine kinase mak2 [Seminavis robusta]|eukprot:Sro20_g014160.1 Peroxide stress-activated histidine kinase mak2 (842) ;mRNA; f:94461-97126